MGLADEMLVHWDYEGAFFFYEVMMFGNFSLLLEIAEISLHFCYRVCRFAYAYFPRLCQFIEILF